MIAYKDYAPTPFDAPGFAAATLGYSPEDRDRSEWLLAIAGYSKSRSATPLPDFVAAEAAFAEVDPEGHDHELHVFANWGGPGWAKLLLVRPGSQCASIAEERWRPTLDGPVCPGCTPWQPSRYTTLPVHMPAPRLPWSG